jgi:hypothetical protein
LLDLLADRWVVPWAEAEARIWQGWKDYPPVQPLPLNTARQRLRDEHAIIEHKTGHKVPVSTVRLPFPAGKKRELERMAGKRSKYFQKYLSWTNTYSLCGQNAERVVFASAQAVATEAGLYVPEQRLGNIDEVDGIPVTPGPLDVLAYIFELPRLESRTPIVFEVKNVHRWVYPWQRELWELLVKAANLARRIPVLPVLVCVRNAYSTRLMAEDVGFLVTAFEEQLFSPTIGERQFRHLREEFGLAMARHEGARAQVVNFGRFLRKTPFRGPEAWYRRQIRRFPVIAPIILAHDALAGALPDDARSRVFSSFRAQVMAVPDIPLTKGW